MASYYSRNTFSNTLRQRAEWSQLPSKLLALKDSSSNRPQWRESVLETHDISLPLPALTPGNLANGMLFLLLSAVDFTPTNAPTTMRRVERLSLLSGGENIAIVFLLETHNEGGEQGGNGMIEFVKLQATLMEMDLPIQLIPLHSAISITATLTTHQRQLLNRRPPRSLRPDPQQQMEILKSCSDTGKRLKNHTVNVLSDVCHGFRELSDWSTSHKGVAAIGEYLMDDEELQKATALWEQEFVAE